MAEDTVKLILEERPFLRRLALSLARHDADADDLVQETVFRALRYRDRFQPGTCIRAWLATILTREFLMVAKTRTRRATRSWTDAGVLGDEIHVAAPAEDDAKGATDFESIQEQLDDAVRHAILQLPAHYREPFCLHVLEDRSCAAIARQLGVPPGTVMSRIFRARSRLRDALGSMTRDGFATRRAVRTKPQSRRSERPAARLSSARAPLAPAV